MRLYGCLLVSFILTLFSANGICSPNKDIDIGRFLGLLEKIIENPDIAKKLKKEFDNLPAQEKQKISLKIRDGFSEFSQLLPMRIDEYTVLDSVMVSKNAVTQKHTIGNNLAVAISSNDLFQEMRSMLINQTCTTPVSGMFILMGYSFFYVYHDENAKYYGAVTITPKDCGY
jgi:hypothetical protein